MKKSKQHALKPLFMVMLFLAVGLNAFSWDTYTINNTDGNSPIVTLQWNAENKCYTGTIPSGNSGKNFNVKAQDSNTGYWGISNSSNYWLTNKTLSESLTKDASSIYIQTPYAVDVVVYTEDGNPIANPKDIKIFPQVWVGGFNGKWGKETLLNNKLGYNTYIVENSTAEQFFSFYDESGNQLSCNNDGVKTDGTPMTTSKSTSACKIPANSGKLVITIVSVNFDTSGGVGKEKYEVTFTVTKAEEGGEGGGETPAPGKIFLVTSKPGNGNGADGKSLIAMNETSDNVYEYTVTDYTGGDLYLYIQEKDANGNVIRTFGSSNTSHGDSGMDNREDIQKGNSKGMTTHSGDVDAGYKYNNSGEIRIRVNFNNNPATFEILADVIDPSTIDYYFIGDLNQWFSNAFTKNSDGTYGKNYDADGNETDTGIDYSFLTKGKGNIPGRDSWKFTYDKNDGWYKFSGFPNAMLAGQFQIFDGNAWAGGRTYSHKVAVRKSGDNLSDEERQKRFEQYLQDCVPVDEYGTEYEVSHDQGQNLHLPCNAVKDATIWFNPDLDGKPVIKVTGTQVDYYIFYDRSGDNDHQQLRAHINSEKPNANNYYIPFNSVEFDNKIHDFTNVGGETNHMNYTAGEDYNANGYQMLRKKFTDVSGLTEDEILAWLPNADDELVTELQKGFLPNGIAIKNHNIWYAKIPNGFACPAGTKFAVAFRNSNDDNSYRVENSVKYPYWTPLGLENLYFFDGIHMHVNSEEIDEVANVKVEYRIYTYDRNYNLVVLDAEDNNTIHTVSSVANDELGWVELGKDHYPHTLWGVDEYVSFGSKNKWRIKEEAATAATNDVAVARKEIPAGLSNAYVQFRFTYSPRGGANAPARAASFNPYSIYIPELPTVGLSENEVKLQGADHYYVLQNGIATGIEGIFGDFNSDSLEDAVSAPVYYNLQGVRVENPTNGLYIKVTGSKSEKVLF